MNVPTFAALLLMLVVTAARADSEPPAFSGFVAAHNAVRAPLGLPPLAWSDVAARQAQGWADQLSTQGCPARYNPDPTRREQYGENILRAYAASPYTGLLRTPADVVRRWAEEGRHYDHDRHQCRMSSGTQCGQYLQLIWETTVHLGCGVARCDSAEVWVCNYTPRGGQEGLKPYGNPRPTPTPVTPAVSQSCESTGSFDFEAALDEALTRNRAEGFGQ